MTEWKTYKLSEIGTVVGGATPSTSVSSYYGGDIPWLTPKDLSNFQDRYIEKGERNITQEGLDSCSAQLLPANTVLFSSRAPIGYVAIAKNPIATNQGFKSIIPNERVDSLFLYYILRYNKERIEAMGSGTTFKEVSGAVMKNVEISLPPLEEQRRIAGILGAIDDKIENNRRINTNLELQAQALFDEWFVANPSNLGAYSKAYLTDIANYLNGLAMQKFRPKDGEKGIPVLKIKELGQGMCDVSSDLCSPSIDKKYIINDGDIIFSWSGTLLVDIWCGGVCGLNQHLFKVTSDKYPKWFVYYWTKYHLAKFIRIAKDKAVTMGHIKRGDLEASEVLIPNETTLNKMDSVIAPIFDAIISHRIENCTLATLCDTLLPKLMNGEIKL